MGQRSSRGHGQRNGQRGRQRRSRGLVTAVICAAVLALALAGAAGSYLLLRTKGSPGQTAASYLRSWQLGRYPAMDAVSAGQPPGGVSGPLRQAGADLGVRRLRLTLRQVTVNGGSALARFTASAELGGGHTWTYQGRLQLVRRNRRWLVNWSPAAIYPALRAGERFALSAAWPARAPILGADGSLLSSDQAIAQSGSLALLTGNVATATAAQARKLGPPYRAGDLFGVGGIEQAYQAQLAGRPSLIITITGPGRRAGGVAARFGAQPGTPVRTSIEMRYQLAASRAVQAAATARPVDVVVIQPSTGRVLAVVERPGGFDRALDGEFPPGSTFKVVTASALARAGLGPASPVQCPAAADIGGRVFHNDNNEQLGATSLQTAFAVSCNTTFALQATQRLSGTALASAAVQFGFNAAPALGVAAVLGQFTTPGQSVDLAADAFGQGTDLVSPLSQAAEAAAIGSGTWRPPVLVTSPAPRQSAAPRPLSAAVLAALRPMMAAVVTSGTARGVGLPAGVHGKTGTAEYGSGANPPSHAWFIGYRADVAFAVLVEGGGTGASSAAPIANAFLRRL